MRSLALAAAVLAAVGAILGLVVIIRELTYTHPSRVVEVAGVGILLVGLAVVLFVIDQAQSRRT
jgi:hypothetical protein